MAAMRRTLVTIATAGAISTGLVLVPASAMLLPPEPEVAAAQESAPSPAMSAGRAWCACQGVAYRALWIE